MRAAHKHHTLGDDEALGLAAARAHGVEIYNHPSAIAVARGGDTATIDLLHREGQHVYIKRQMIHITLLGTDAVDG